METQERFRVAKSKYFGTIGEKEYVIKLLDSHTGKLHASRIVNGEVVPYITIIAKPEEFCTLTFRGEKCYKVQMSDGTYGFSTIGEIK